MVIRGARTSLARARMIRSARRSRSGKVFSNSAQKNTSSRLNQTSGKQNTETASQTKKIAMYEEVQKAASELKKAANTLLELGKTSGDVKNATAQEAVKNTADTQTPTKTKTEEEQKKELIAGVEELVKQYNIICENLSDLGGTVNSVFVTQLKSLMGNCEKELEKTGVAVNRDGTLSVTKKTLEGTELATLKSVYCKSSGVTDKLIERAEYIGSNAASTIEVMNRMYGTQTYNKYGTGTSYYGSNGSWYNAIG